MIIAEAVLTHPDMPGAPVQDPRRPQTSAGQVKRQAKRLPSSSVSIMRLTSSPRVAAPPWWQRRADTPTSLISIEKSWPSLGRRPRPLRSRRSSRWTTSRGRDQCGLKKGNWSVNREPAAGAGAQAIHKVARRAIAATSTESDRRREGHTRSAGTGAAGLSRPDRALG